MKLPNMKEAKIRNKSKVNYLYDDYNSSYDATGKKFMIITYGCQMNVHDSENIKGIMEDIGASETENMEEECIYPDEMYLEDEIPFYESSGDMFGEKDTDDFGLEPDELPF